MLPDVPELTPDPATHPERRADDIPRDVVVYILNLGRALHASGYAAHRLEAVLPHATPRLGGGAPLL
jgi:hypothetical protein